MTNRGEAIGVLELRLPQAPDDQTPADMAAGAHALAYVVIANRRYTDAMGHDVDAAVLATVLVGALRNARLAGLDLRSPATGCCSSPTACSSARAVQHLMTAVIEAADGELEDDATALCLDWHGGPERERTSAGGADR